MSEQPTAWIPTPDVERINAQIEASRDPDDEIYLDFGNPFSREEMEAIRVELDNNRGFEDPFVAVCGFARRALSAYHDALEQEREGD
jgi:hypothetical protein